MTDDQRPLPSWAVHLRNERRQKGWSQKQLVCELFRAAGPEISLPEPASVLRRIKDHEAGTHRPKDPYPLLYCRVFGKSEARLFGTEAMLATDLNLGLTLDSDPLQLLQQIGQADIERRTLLTNAAYSVAAAALPLTSAIEAVSRTQAARSGSKIGSAEIQAVKDMTKLFTTIDEWHGGQHGRSAVVQYLRSDIATLCRARFTSERHHDEMLSAAASVAYLTGWKAYDASEHGLAQRYYLQAYALTREANADLHSAFVLRILAHNGMDINYPGFTLDLAEAALSRIRGKVDPATEATFIVTRARAFANADRPQEAIADIAHANRLVSDSDERDVPYWAAIWGSARATIASHTAKTLARVGDYAAAEASFAESAQTRDPSRRRIIALTLADEGRMQFQLGDVEKACATWHRALDLIEGVASARIRESFAKTHTHLKQPRIRNLAVAKDLRTRINGQ
ncbi:hypothetical protein [Nonomuraea typhae]|uniref:XRE family transcriptional regulator n=1 Tax=Nonomuraea typhae TaxID=2603600 RepID=A0ABW7YKJ9_9ACTN